MNPIRILSPDLTILGEIDDYESLMFIRRWHRPGEFEIHINRHKRNVDSLQKDNLVILGRGAQNIGVIKHREITLDESGKQGEVWKIVGQSLGEVLARRITFPPVGQAYDSIRAPAETVMKHYVLENAIAPEDPKRSIEQMVNETDQARGSVISWQTRYAPLTEELEKLSLASGLGWGVVLDLSLRKYVFEVYEGRDLTVGQFVNPPVIFSPEFESIKTQHFVDSEVNYRNVAIVAGQGEGELRDIVEVGEASGLDRKEVFIDARDLPETDSLYDRGQQKLDEMQADLLLEGQIMTTGPFRYGEDYDLGDIVTIRNKDWGVTLDGRITEVKEVYEPSGFALEATFGSSFPTLISRVKQELSQISAEIRR
ncbi:hypothetical protein EDM59_01490 [Brevibacillus nitrificans]|uniref:Gp28/Gp37-like domain-containing protein n=1 Tax=Brevibacillus nitrificans TaxID=651560 RepID=A0A3M8DT40_9BACL|nr:siphovirus ReqiPepy6 Gp37-like family protein [Brevibacillus nitrificans]RNB90147.1 hypothetical protein EDM59_01490 [Brevibacillus nitrificans]